MKRTITPGELFSLASITDAHSQTFTAYISADIHDEQTLHDRAVELLYADALISGAGIYDRVKFLDAINTLGADISVTVSEGIFTMRIRAAGSMTQKVLGLVAVMLSAPHFNRHELKRIKQTVVNALKESKEDTRTIAHEQLRNTMYGVQDRRYAFAEDDLIKAIANVTPKDLQTLHKTIMALPWTCSVASTESTVTLFERQVRKLKKLSVKTTVTRGIHQQKPPQPTIVLRDVPSKQNIDFSIGAPVPMTLHHPDYVPLSFALAVLGIGGLQGRLMRSVREKEGLTYGIYAKAETFYSHEQGYWRVATFFAPDKAVQGLTSTFREITTLFDEGITDEELVLFKQNISTKDILLNDSTSSMLRNLHSYHVQKFSLREIEEYKERVYTLTKEDVNAVIKRYLDPRLLTVSGAGPVARVKKELQVFMKTVS